MKNSKTRKTYGKAKKDADKSNAVDWKDPKTIAEMGVAFFIIVLFMMFTGAFGVIM